MSDVVEIHGIDVDGVLFNEAYLALCNTSAPDYDNVVKTNPTLINAVSSAMRKSTVTVKRIIPTTNRGSLHYDIMNHYEDGSGKYRGSAFPALEKFAQAIQKEVNDCTLDKFIMADIYGSSKEGSSFQSAKVACELREISATNEKLDIKDFANWAFDENKISVVYAHMHKFMTEFKDKAVTVNYHVYDDREDILEAILTFFSTHPDLKPKGLNLILHHVKSAADIVLFGELKANRNGLVDECWRQSVIDMAKLCGYPEKTKHISPEKVLTVNSDTLETFITNRNQRMGIKPKQRVKFSDAPATQAQIASNLQIQALLNPSANDEADDEEEKDESEVVASSDVGSRSYSGRSSLSSSSRSKLTMTATPSVSFLNAAAALALQEEAELIISDGMGVVASGAGSAGSTTSLRRRRVSHTSISTNEEVEPDDEEEYSPSSSRSSLMPAKGLTLGSPLAFGTAFFTPPSEEGARVKFVDRSASPSHLHVIGRDEGDQEELSYRYASRSATPRAAGHYLDEEENGDVVVRNDKHVIQVEGHHPDEEENFDDVGVDVETNKKAKVHYPEEEENYGDLGLGVEADKEEKENDQPIIQYEEELNNIHIDLRHAIQDLDKVLANINYDQSLRELGHIVRRAVVEAKFKTRDEEVKATEAIDVTRRCIVNPENEQNFNDCGLLVNEVIGRTSYWNMIGGCLLILAGLALMAASVTMGILSQGFVIPFSIMKGFVLSKSLIEAGVTTACGVLGVASVIKGPLTIYDGMQHGVAKALSGFWNKLKPMQKEEEEKLVPAPSFMEKLSRI